MISKYFTTSVAVSRTAYVGGKSSASAVGTILAHVQQTGPEEAQQMQQAFGLAHTFWCATDEDVEVGDTLAIAAGPFTGSYNVRSVMRNVAVGRNQHLEVTAIKDKS